MATLTLMMLLGLIAVGLLAVASSQNRIAAQTILQAEARQQALIGLDAAISDLQMEAGPDQRVTASSAILSQNQSDSQHLLGVWDSWQAPLYGTHNGADIRSTYTAGRASMFRRWLISCSDLRRQRQLNAINDLGKQKPGYRICMVGEGTLGPDTSKEEYVYADLISMPSPERNETCFAWWVGGENQKANVAIADQPPTNDPIEILHRTWDTPAPVFRDSKNLDFLPKQIQEPQKLVDLKTLPLVNSGGVDVGQPYFFDATTFSYSLITNPRDGGLKLDLNLLLNKENLEDTPMRSRTNQDCPLAEGEGLPTGTEASFPIGSWQALHAFYNLWPDGTAAEEDFTSPRLVGGVSEAHARMGGHLERGTTEKGDAVTFFDEKARFNENQYSGYARTPVLLSFYGAYGMIVYDPYNPDGRRDGQHSYGHAYAPFFLWWNPYNVPLRVGAKKLWAHSLIYRTNSVLLWQPSKDNTVYWTRSLMLQPGNAKTNVDTFGAPGQVNGYANDWGNYFVHSQDDQSSDIVFEPGEILMFSMAEGFNNMERLISSKGQDGLMSFSQPQKIPFVQGDQVGMLHNYFISMYSDDGNSGSGERTSYIMKLALETKTGYSSSGYITTKLDQDAQYVSGGEVYDTIGDYLGPGERGLFAVTHGFNGVDASQAAGQNPTESRLTARLDRFIGAEGISPYTFNLGWYDYDTTSIDDATFVSDMQWDMSMYKEPYYYAAVGIAPKSYNQSLRNALPAFNDKDYRTKNWVHSSPAMGGGTLYKPDDQQRQYHPFQLSAVEVDAKRVMDTVNSKNGIYGIQSVGTGGGEAVSFISVLELPVHPPFSLAGFSGMRLKPGWYYTTDTGRMGTLANMRRMQYQAGVPGVGIGNSFADPCLPSDGVYAFHQTKISSDLKSNATVFSDFYDHGFIINDALWDRWFCSSVSDMPGARGRVQARDTLDAFVKGEQALPVSRYKLAHSSVSQDQVVSQIMSGDGWKQIARYLMVEGGFNVNSVSEDAWAAVLQGLAKRELVSNTDNHLHTVEHRGEDNVLFPRFMVSTADRTMDGSGSGYNMLLGAAFLRPSMKMATAWGDVRSLSPDQIRQLAREMVKKVRERGPFLNMADFINRRLDGGTDAALTGALQAAIDATDINRDLMRADFMVHPLPGDFYSFPRAEEGSMYTAAPGYLIQSDVLMSLGNILTVRDDTFTVRAYGCVRNARHAILAQAWCEAVVQRTIEYVDPTNSPTDGGYDPANQGTSGGNQSKLSEVNRLMGRKMRVVSFKWLDSWDI